MLISQQQPNSHDCGIFAIAKTVDLCPSNGLENVQYRYIVREVRDTQLVFRWLNSEKTEFYVNITKITLQKLKLILLRNLGNRSQKPPFVGQCSPWNCVWISRPLVQKYMQDQQLLNSIFKKKMSQTIVFIVFILHHSMVVQQFCRGCPGQGQSFTKYAFHSRPRTTEESLRSLTFFAFNADTIRETPRKEMR